MEVISEKQMENTQQQISDSKWQQGKAIGTCMEELLTREQWTDVEFQCKDHDTRGTIKAHKVILAARSPVFEAMFFGPCADGKNMVEIKDIESDVFFEFLRYMYSDTVNLEEDIVFSLIETAHLYQVDHMVACCAEFLCTILSSQNACGILMYALRYELENLRNTCCSFIDNNTEDVLKSDCFINLSETALLYILKGDTLYAKEEDIIEAAEKWSKKRLQDKGLEESGANIRTCLGEAFFYLRIPTLTNKSLLEFISRKGYLSVEEYSDIAAFINDVDGSTVSTNSCVKRIPESECVTVDTEDDIEVICDDILMYFDVSLKKDVTVTSISFNKMKPSFKEMNNLYTTTTIHHESIQRPEGMTINCKSYENKIVKISSRGANLK